MALILRCLSFVIICFVSIGTFAKSKPSYAYEQEAPSHSRVTYDLGAAVGSYNNISYTEIGLGLNWFFNDYLVWRNALFSRFGSEIDSIYGLDSSVRGVLGAGNSALGITVFAGPGYRFVSKGDNAPFLEGGLILKLAGFSLGGGAKALYYSNRAGGLPNQETIYFIILSGGGSF